MIAASDFVVDYWGVIIAVLFLAPPSLRLLFKVSKQAALLRDHFLLKLPFLGDVIPDPRRRALPAQFDPHTESGNRDHRLAGDGARSGRQCRDRT
jgi:hypothetical protein